MNELNELEALLGPDAVVTDPDRLAAHVRDWTGRWEGSTPAVVFPSTTGHIVEIIDWCRRTGTAIVPQGGNTGMVGGSVPLGGELVVSTARINHIEVDADSGTVVAGAGATLGQVQEAAAEAGWSYAVDLGARDTATIGGTVATNAGGVQVIRHGDTRHQLLGIEAVTGTGEVVGDLRGLHKDNTGYDLASLLAGSEGTLAVVTQVCLKLVPAPADVATALVAFGSEVDAFAAIGPIRRRVEDLLSLEVMFAAGMDLVCDTFDLANPFADTHAAFLLVEAAGPDGALDRLGEHLGRLETATDVAVATSADRRHALWRLREAHTEAINLVGVPHKLDITLPLEAMVDTMASIRTSVASHAPDASVWVFGHAGDGNLHVNITGADPDDDRVDEIVLELVAAAGGSISAEHGIGRAKAGHLHLNRTAAERDLAARIKHAFDPDGILNPGVILPGHDAQR